MKKYLLIFVILVLLGVNIVFAKVYFSVNTGCDGGVYGMGGGMVYDYDGESPLLVGSILQYIYAGENKVPDVPGKNGEVGGDDLLLSTARVGDDNVWEFFSDAPGMFYNGVSGKLSGDNNEVIIFVRAWNQEEITKEAHYGDSEVILADSSMNIMPIPSDIILGSFETNVLY